MKGAEAHRCRTNWSIYIILCSDGTLYTGITTDVERRLRQHGRGQGARYFRGRRPQSLLYLEHGHTRSSAGKREAEIKGLTRADKHALIASLHNELHAAAIAGQGQD